MGDADLDWVAVSEACEPILTSRTAREWDIGAGKENVAAGGTTCEFQDISNDLWFEAPARLSEKAPPSDSFRP